MMKTNLLKIIIFISAIVISFSFIENIYEKIGMIECKNGIKMIYLHNGLQPYIGNNGGYELCK